MVRTRQGGSVLSFVVVGVLLLAIFAGGAYVVRQNMQPAQEELPTELPGGQPEEGKAPQETPRQPTPEDRGDSRPGNTTPEKEGPAPQEAPQSRETEPSEGTSEGGRSHAATLPATGPSQLLASLLAAGLLSATAVSYLRSRRPGLSL